MLKLFSFFRGDSIENKGNNNVIIQASGIDYNTIRQIFMDLFKANYLELSNKAADISIERIEAFGNKFLEELSCKHNDLFSKLENPSIQYSIYNAQKEYAKFGGEDLEQIFMGLLIERMKSNDRTLTQIVIDESIITTSKITKNQTMYLSFMFLLIHLKDFNIKVSSLQTFVIFLNKNLIPFYGSSKRENFFKHLEYSGCCAPLSQQRHYKSMIEIFKTTYKGIFSIGFTIIDFEKEFGCSTNYKGLITQCLHNKELYQIGLLNENILNLAMHQNKIDISQKDKLINFWNRYMMTSDEIERYLISINPIMKDIIKFWDNSNAPYLALTPVGICIGLMNYKIYTKDESIGLDMYL